MSDEDIEEGDSFIDNSSLNLLIKVTSSMVVLLSILIISLWAVYQTADVTFGGPPSSLELWEDEYREMTGLDRVDGFEGSGVKICIVDTGIDMSHPDLEDANIIGWNDLISGSDSPYDDEGHGTAMAGIIASKGGLNGVSPEADLLIAKAISDDGSGTDSTIADAVDWCVNGGADIISLSLGGSQGFGSGFFTTDQLEESVQEAIDLGVYVVAAAGNDGGPDDDGDVASPGSVEDVICVGAIDTDGTIWSNSSVGNNGFNPPENWIPRQNPDQKPELVAPGENLAILNAQINTDVLYAWGSGTSGATVWVSGAIAHLLEHRPDLAQNGTSGGSRDTVEDVKGWIQESVAPKDGQAEHDNYYGYGRLKVDTLLSMAA